MTKTKIFIVLFSVLLFTRCSWSEGSYLQLSLYDDGEFSVIMDDLEYSGTGNVAEFENLQPGEHNLIVTRYSTATNTKQDIVFQGKIKIPAGLNLYAVIDEYNAFTIYKKVPTEKGKCKCDCGYYRYIGKNGNPDHQTKHVNENDIECRGVVMSDKDFKDFKKSISNLNFEGSNVNIAKSMLDANTVSTSQVQELLGYFNFESNKLDVAKYAYTHTCDRKNYYKLYTLFDFDSSVEELKNYISGK